MRVPRQSSLPPSSGRRDDHTARRHLQAEVPATGGPKGLADRVIDRDFDPQQIGVFLVCSEGGKLL